MCSGSLLVAAAAVPKHDDVDDTIVFERNSRLTFSDVGEVTFRFRRRLQLRRLRRVVIIFLLLHLRRQQDAWRAK